MLCSETGGTEDEDEADGDFILGKQIQEDEDEEKRKRRTSEITLPALKWTSAQSGDSRVVNQRLP
jgi:hypothetical protein